MTVLLWLWSNKGMLGVGVLIVGLCILFGIKEVELGKARIDLATCQATNVKLTAEIAIQNTAVAALGKTTVEQRAEVARLLKLLQPKVISITHAADASAIRIKPSVAIIKQGMGCNEALFDAAKDMEGLK